MNSKHCLAAALVLTGLAAVQAQTVVVDKTGVTPGSVTTIADALAGTATDIVVKNTGVYNEGISITRSVTLRGEDPGDRPVVALKGLTSQPVLGPGDGVYIGGTGGSEVLDITFKNFVLIPATTDGPTDDGMSVSPNPGTTMKFNMENILLAPNDGSDKPLATSVWDNPDFNASGVVRIPDDGIYLMDDQFAGFAGDIQATLKDVVFIGVGGATTNGDAFVLYPGRLGNSSLTLSGLGASYSSRYAAQVSGTMPVTVTGTNENPGWVARKNKVGPICFSSSGLQIDHMVSIDNADCGLRTDADTNASISITDSLFVNNFFQGVVIPFEPEAAKVITVARSTFYNNDSGNNNIANLELAASASSNITLNVVDCIFAGSQADGIQNNGGSGVTVNADHCAFVTAGPDALSVTTVNVNETGTINADPQFVSTAFDPLLATGFDVQNMAYATASSTGGELNGWGDGPTASVSDWTIY